MNKKCVWVAALMISGTVFGASSPERAAVARRIAAESIALMKNDGVLPLAAGATLCPVGPVTEKYFIIGGGSAFVHTPYSIEVTNALKSAGFTLDETSREIAIWTISRFNAEDSEQPMEKFDLNETELKTLAELKAKGFKKIVVILNTGHVVGIRRLKEDPAVSAILSVWYPGMEGGNAIVDVLSGKENPSGRLTATWAETCADYPSDSTWQEARQYVPYEEDIFVGYRYFSTIPSADRKVVYPFGHGLSYTTFALADAALTVTPGTGGVCRVRVKVTNTGKVAGRHSVLAYSSVAGGKAQHPVKELRGFAKTACLKPGESEVAEIVFNRRDLAYFDDEGVSGRIGSWVLDGGTYTISVGGSVDETVKAGAFEQEETILSTPGFKLDPSRLKRRLRADGSWANTPLTYGDKNGSWGWTPYKKELAKGEQKASLFEVARGEKTLDEFIDALPLADLTKLLHGGANIIPAGNTCSIGYLPDYGVTGLQTADGPVGIRLEDKDNETNRWSTAFPATALAVGSFDLELLEAYGRAIGEEAAAVGVDIHLAPGICLSRHPMCGRNFEYMGEDPYLAGRMAAAFIRGVQSQGVASTIKHFAFNNRENTRNESYSIVTERAARELYLKGFEIAVKEAKPKCLMTSYNGLNGRRTGMTWGLVTGILRDEWGYEGLVMSDWGARAQLWEEVAAGSNVKMPDANGGTYDFGYLCERGAVDPKMVRASVRRVLKLVMESPRFKAAAAAVRAASETDKGPVFEVTAWRGETVYGIVPEEAVGVIAAASCAGIEVSYFGLMNVRGVVTPWEKESQMYADRVVATEKLKHDRTGVRIYRAAVSAATPPGCYRLGAMKLRVLDQILPPAAEWAYHLDLWQHPWAVARAAGVEPFSPAHYERMKLVFARLAEAGQKVLTTTLLDLPWNHQCFDGYHSMIARVRRADGTWSFDYRTFDEYVAFGRACGIGPEIACYTMCPWGNFVSWQDEAGETVRVEAKPGSEAFADFWGAFLGDFERHLKEKGWLDETYIAMDERSPEEVQAIVGFVREKAPGLKISMAGNRNPADFRGITIERYSQLISYLDEDFLAEVGRRRAAGLKTTFYVCCYPERPNTHLKSDADEAFWLGAYPAFAGFDGFLRWAANSWPENPLKDASFGTWPAGDTFLIYPDGEISLRFLNLRAGIVAAEKLRILRERGELSELPEKLRAEFDFRKALSGEIDFAAARAEFLSCVNAGQNSEPVR